MCNTRSSQLRFTSTEADQLKQKPLSLKALCVRGFVALCSPWFDSIKGNSLLLESTVRDENEGSFPQSPPSDIKLGICEQAFSATGAAFLSIIIVNPLDVAKTRLQAQAAGVAYSRPLSNMISCMAHFGPNVMFADLQCSPSCARAGIHGMVSICPPDCFWYRGTLDPLQKKYGRLLVMYNNYSIL